jgi:hypothetical protein
MKTSVFSLDASSLRRFTAALALMTAGDFPDRVIRHLAHLGRKNVAGFIDQEI